MKNTTYLLFSLLFLFSVNTNATTYTSVANGNYDVATTWKNGIVPPKALTGSDTVYINQGDTVKSYDSISFLGVNAAFIVNGVFWEHRLLTINNAFLYCEGSMQTGNFNFDSQLPITLANNGTIRASTSSTGNLTVTGLGKLDFSGRLDVHNGIVTSINSAEIELGNHIRMMGGAIVYNTTGFLRFSSAYRLTYLSGAAGTTTGDELLGTNSLFEFTVDIGANKELKLGSFLEIRSLGRIKSGILKLNGQDVYVVHNGVIGCSDSAWIHSTSSSNITLSGGNNLPNYTLRFIKGGQKVGVLDINQRFGGVLGTAGALPLTTDLYVTKKLLLQCGHINVGDNTLYVLKGADLIRGSDTSYILATQKGGLSRYVTKGQTVKFPIGTAKQYQELLLTPHDKDQYVKASTIGDVYEYGYTGSSLAYLYQPYVEACWYVWADDPVFDMDMQVSWFVYNQHYLFDDSHAYISRHDSVRWDTYPPAAATALPQNKRVIQRKHVKRQGVFTVLDGNAVLSLTEALATEKTITLYPNPAKDVLHVQGVSHGETVEVYNSLGQLVQTEVLRNNSINVSALSAGVYYLTVDRKEKPAVISFVKQAQ